MTKQARHATADVSRLVEWLQQHEGEMAALLAELVAIPTENPPGRNYRACADVLEDRLRQELSRLRRPAGGSIAARRARMRAL